MKKDFILGVIVSIAIYSYGALWLYVIYPIFLK